MYIKRIKIKNIRAISDFEMTFDEPAGWHVLIGDNGSGKSTIVRAVAATLIGMPEIMAARLVWKNWLKKDQEEGSIKVELEYDENYDGEPFFRQINHLDVIGVNQFFFKKRKDESVKLETNINEERSPTDYNWGNNEGYFSAAYGPFRRFTGGDESKNVIFESSPRVGAHLSVFGEDVALTEALKWLRDLDDKRLRESRELQAENMAMLVGALGVKEGLSDLDVKEKIKEIRYLLKLSKEEIEKLALTKQEKSLLELKNKYFKVLDKKESIFTPLKHFINQSSLLPHNTVLEGFDIDGNIVFIDGGGNKIQAVEMSDGFRSILSLMFDLIRQLVRVYGEEAVFKNIKAGEMTIPLPGVVLIDEVDAHLHPTWQTRIGQWFTQYFPQIQFIVTTHSPLVCRASEKGSIWQLATPVNGGKHKQIIGAEKDRLVFGNILDAYGTELFGQSPVRSEKSNKKLERLGRLNTRYALGKITKEEEKEREALLKILKTDDPTGI